ncbi:MAG: hypothetical protein B6I28_00795 [Fusobacteriia bacterium 4572_132]|nr:MAG: hypothetical protein B6I28_00795 [Fusobacteriia bacterium 4572_132]
MKRGIKYLIIMVVMIITIMNSYADGHILAFHRFGDDRYSSSNITLEDLNEIVDYLNENQYKVISLNEIIEKISKKEEISDKIMCITIDDAYKSFFDNGLEVLKRNNFPFTVFINTEAVDKNYTDYMTWKEIKEVSKYGEIGSHSYSHPHLTKIGNQKAMDDIQKSIEGIEKKINKKVKYFAYPYGEYNDEIKWMLKSIGMQGIFNQSLGAISGESDIFDLDRMAISNLSGLKWKLKIKYLKAHWMNVEREENYIKSIKVEIDKSIKKVQVYLSGYGWEKVDVENGIIEFKINKELRNARNRVIIKTYANEWSNKLMMKK